MLRVLSQEWVDTPFILNSVNDTGGVRVYVSHVSSFDFKPEGEDRNLTGTKLRGIDFNSREDVKTSFGHKPIEMDGPLTLLDQFKKEEVPGYYDLSFTFKQKAGKSGKTMLTPFITGVVFVGFEDPAKVKARA